MKFKYKKKINVVNTAVNDASFPDYLILCSILLINSQTIRDESCGRRKAQS